VKVLSPLNYQERFLKYKDIIIEEMIQEFGEQYREDIIERVNSHSIILQGNPLDDYTYLCTHTEKIKFTDRFIIKERYRKLEKIKEKARNELMDEFEWFIAAFFKIDKSLIEKNSKELVSLFANENFDESYIDSYSFSNIDLLNRMDTPQIVKESILNDQQTLKEKLGKFGIIVDEEFINQVDGFLEKRGLEKEEYYHKILKSNFSYNRELSKLLQEKNPDILFHMSFFKLPSRTVIIKPDGEINKYLFCPVVRLINQNINSLDTTLIHELVHTVEKEGNGKSSIIDEIIVQKAAINITNRLHENGIFIFDDKENCVVEGACTYEVLFPLIDPILSNYYNLLKEELVDGDIHSLDKVFGESWKKFEKELEQIYTVFYEMSLKVNGLNWKTDLSNLNRYMEEMSDFYHRGGKHV